MVFCKTKLNLIKGRLKKYIKHVLCFYCVSFNQPHDNQELFSFYNYNTAQKYKFIIKMFFFVYTTNKFFFSHVQH